MILMFVDLSVEMDMMVVMRKWEKREKSEHQYWWIITSHLYRVDNWHKIQGMSTITIQSWSGEVMVIVMHLTHRWGPDASNPPFDATKPWAWDNYIATNVNCLSHPTISTMDHILFAKNNKTWIEILVTCKIFNLVLLFINSSTHSC